MRKINRRGALSPDEGYGQGTYSINTESYLRISGCSLFCWSNSNQGSHRHQSVFGPGQPPARPERGRRKDPSTFENVDISANDMLSGSPEPGNRFKIPVTCMQEHVTLSMGVQLIIAHMGKWSE